MKNLEPKAIEQLLSIIPNHPATAILHISDGGDEFCDKLKDFTAQNDYEYRLNITDRDFFEKKKIEYESYNWCKVNLMRYEQRRYVTMAKMYDFVFVTANVPESNQEEFVKRINSHMKNGANIILFLPKGDIKSKYKWYEYLDEALFVATNSIDIFKNYEIVISKKMHGWGN